LEIVGQLTIADEFNRQASTFRSLQKLLSAKGDFRSMQLATVCAGLAEVAEMLLAFVVKIRKSE
jgi:hypothetical protein